MCKCWASLEVLIFISEPARRSGSGCEGQNLRGNGEVDDHVISSELPGPAWRTIAVMASRDDQHLAGRHKENVELATVGQEEKRAGVNA